MPAAPVTSNTRDCFSTFIGRQVVGVLFDALPVGRKDLAAGTKTLVFDDGRGLTISSKGTFWVESEREIERAIKSARKEMERTKADLAGVLELAGAHAA